MSSTHSYNNTISQCLNELANIKVFKGDILKSRIYKKAYESILSYDKPIYSISDITNIKGIGKSILKQIDEYITNGYNEETKIYKSTPNYLFTQIHGVGPKKANELVKSGIISIEQLRVELSKNPKLLNNIQQIGLQYYEHINERIPRSEIDEYSFYIKQVVNKYNTLYHNKYDFEIVGSYRRGASTSGDIDIILTNNSFVLPHTPLNIQNFVDLIKEDFQLVEELSVGSKKSMLITKLSKLHSLCRRVDILYTPPTEYPYAILYFTGSATFNTLMRKHALTLGYTLNEHGLYKMTKNIKGELLNINIQTEEDIFNFLNIEYKHPSERIGALSIVETEKSLLELYKANGYSYIETLELTEIETLYKEACSNYYNSETTTILSDEMFDILADFIKTKYPHSKVIHSVGSYPDSTKKKVKLPYYMGSMNKIKPDTGALAKWKTKYKGPYMLSAKLDGVSGMIVYNKGIVSLYTRGNGTIGQDISHLLPYFFKLDKIPLINQQGDKSIEIVFRGEFIISKDNFNTHFSSIAANPRNFVSGVINSKIVDTTKLQYIDFIPYEMIKPSILPFDQFEHIVKIWDNYVIHQPTSYDYLTNEMLSDFLKDLRANYKYEIDGIIITDNNLYSRKSSNPEHSIAFKMILTEQVVEAKVIDVLWNPSKDGYLKPRVQIEPVNIGGAIIEYATGFNGSFIQNNGIGFGSIVQLVRSGDVIPHIMKVIKSVDPKMPNIDYVWNSTNIDIMLPADVAETNKIVIMKQIVLTLEKLGIAGLGEGNVKKLINKGFDSIYKIINMSVDDFLTIDGFKDKMANKLFSSIHNAIDSKSVVDIIIALGIFGRGIGAKKIEKVLDIYPNYFSDIVLSYKEGTLSKIDEYKKIINIDSFADKTAKQFVNNLDKCIQVITQMNLEHKLLQPVVKQDIEPTSSILSGKKIVMSGFRSKELEALIKQNGGKVESSLTKSVSILIVKDKTEITSKIEKAMKYSIPIMTIEEFTNLLHP